MSDDFVESIWAQFAIETEEHLETIERILVEMEVSAGAVDDVTTLFRSFHSLKGLFGAVDMFSLERLAHSAENLLGLVRDGGMAVSADFLAVLLQCVDEMKRLGVLATEQRMDAPVTAGLLEHMAALFVQAGGPELYLELEQAAATDHVSDDLALHEDPEMLGFFLELLQENMPVFCDLLGGYPFRDETVEEAASTLSTLARAAESVGFTRLAEVMEALLALWEAGPQYLTAGSAASSMLAELVTEYYQLLGYIEEEAGQEGGSRELASALAAVMASSMQLACAGIHETLDQLDIDYASGAADADGMMPGLHAVQAHLARLNAGLRFLCPEKDEALLPFVEDVFGRVVQGDIPMQPEILDIARESVNRACQLSSDASVTVADEHELLERLQRCIWVAEHGEASDDSSMEAEQAFVASLPLSEDIREALSSGNIRELMQATEEGLFLHEVLVNLERSEDVASDFLDWVARCGRIITNTSRFIGGECWYQMLVVSSLDAAGVDSALKQIDASHKLLLMRGDHDASITSPDHDVALANPTASPLPANATVRGQSAAIRVQGEVLDNLVKQIGEMVLIRAQLNYIVTAEETRAARLMLKGMISQIDGAQAGAEIQERLLQVSDVFEAQARKLAEVDAQIQSALSRLHDSAMAMRVVPMETVLKRFPRVVRDLAQALGKSIRLDLLGQEVRIDKAMVEILSDPLLHMVRNSVDHGIESAEERKALGKSATANIQISAYQQGARVVVQLSDDGRGIDPEKIIRKAMEKGWVDEAAAQLLSLDDIYNFLFMPGFSTADRVTETSGRGVGMDVIRNNVSKMGGSIHIRSEKGLGTTFTLEMPLSAAVQDVMLVEVAGQALAIPGRYIAEVIEIDGAAIQTIKGRDALLLRGNFLPVVSLADLLGFAEPASPALAPATLRFRTAMVITDGQQMVAVEVDRLVGRRELFVKDVHKRLVELPGVGGASVMGDGTIVLILDGDDLLRIAEQMSQRRVPRQAAERVALHVGGAGGVVAK